MAWLELGHAAHFRPGALVVSKVAPHDVAPRAVMRWPPWWLHGHERSRNFHGGRDCGLETKSSAWWLAVDNVSRPIRLT